MGCFMTYDSWESYVHTVAYSSVFSGEFYGWGCDLDRGDLAGEVSPSELNRGGFGIFASSG